MPINQHQHYTDGSHPGLMPRPCEYRGCTQVVPQRYAHNLVVVYLHSAYEAPSYQCTDIEHWTCSHEHAVSQAHLCLDEHVLTRLRGEDWSHNPARWQHPSFADTYVCEHDDCTSEQTGHQMHGFVISYRFPGGELNAIGTRECVLHLGCSSEHAAKAAHGCIDTHTAQIRAQLRLEFLAHFEREPLGSEHFFLPPAAPTATPRSLAG